MLSRSSLILLVAAVLALSSSSFAQRRDWRILPETQPTSPRGLMAKVLEYKSAVDGEIYPYAVCATDETDEPKPMILIVSPGGTALANACRLVRGIADMVHKNEKSCVVVRPTGRGPGSLYMHYGEMDVLETIKDVCAQYAIDRDRITVYGGSMGGAATFYLTTHYPDLFAAASPLAGYSDYRLWKKAGGWTYQLHPWEKPSWQSRSAAFLPENLKHTPYWIFHGERDRALGGGVPVEHSRQMFKRLTELGYEVKYTEVVDGGHVAMNPGDMEAMILWLLDHKKDREPSHVPFVTYELRHNSHYWVRVEQLETYGQRTAVDARLTNGPGVKVMTENVRTLTLGPLPGQTSVEVELDGQVLRKVNLTRKDTFRRDPSGSWSVGPVDMSGQKRHKNSGPMGDLFFDRTLLVAGTTGNGDETEYISMLLNYMKRAYSLQNGGVHRGGITGQTYVRLASAADEALSESQRKNNNLILFGTHKTNSVLSRYKDVLPLRFEDRAIELAGKRFTGDAVAVFAIFPHPENPDRYVAVHGGVTADATIDGSHLAMALLPDYIVYDGPEVLEWGFFTNDWKLGG